MGAVSIKRLLISTYLLLQAKVSIDDFKHLKHSVNVNFEATNDVVSLFGIKGHFNSFGFL